MIAYILIFGLGVWVGATVMAICSANHRCGYRERGFDPDFHESAPGWAGCPPLDRDLEREYRAGRNVL